MRFGRDDQRIARHRLGEIQDAAGGSDIIGMVDDIGRAFGMRGDGRVGVLRLELEQFGFAERLMHDAHARPQQHVAAQLTLQISAQMLVRAKDDLLIGRDLRQDLFGGGRRHDDVGQRLHLGRTVDVAQRNMIGMRLAERLELGRGATVLQAASRVHVRQHDNLVRGQNFRRFRHEADAAERDDIRVRLRRLARQLQRIPDEIGQVLNLGRLVVMSQDDGVALLAQPVDFRAQVQSLQ